MAKDRTNPPSASTLLIALDRDGGSLHHQIEAALRDQIRGGRLAAGAALPPTRTLATEPASPAESSSRPTPSWSPRDTCGAGAAATPRWPSSPDREPPTPDAPTRPTAVDFGYGRANVAAFPRRSWMRSMRRAITEAPDERLAYPDGKGAPELRRALADYLDRVRGTDIVAANLVIANGYGQGLGLLLGVLADRGARRIAVEDPSPDDAREIAARLGLEVVAVPVGEEGIAAEALDSLAADALVLTPSHQWPTGSVLSAAGRAAVVAWARRSGALVIEDDYDAEFRYDRSPIGAMQGLAPDQVVYAGTVSKTLAPGIRIGWLALPPDLVADFAAAKLRADRGSPVMDQLAFADFLGRGEFDRHLRRMRPIYRGRRDTLVEALRSAYPIWQSAGVAAGLDLVAWLPDGLDENRRRGRRRRTRGRRSPASTRTGWRRGRPAPHFR